MDVWFIIFTALLFLTYVWIKRKQEYWKRIGVEQASPTFLLGNLTTAFFNTASSSESVQNFYKSFPKSRYVGLYQFLKPTLLIRDPELIEQITVKDFDYFTDHKLYTAESDQHLFALKGEKWKQTRSSLSPAFAGSKMKTLFGLMDESTKNFTDYFLKKTRNKISIEAKEVFTRFTNDVIAAIAFGINCDSLANPNNKFYSNGAKTFTVANASKVLLFDACPKLFHFLGLGIFSSNLARFFKSVVKDTIESREKNNAVRADMIQILLEAKKEQSKESQKSKKYVITDDDIVAQSLGFFFAGFDAISKLLTYTTYELALNPDIQQTIREEALDALQKNGGILTYDSIMNLKYIDMVVSESLRKYPPAEATDRVCVKPYTITPKLPHEQPIHLKIGDPIWIPIYPLHRDSEHYQNPERFDPQRFNEENKKHIKPHTYIPFGIGPRFCMGARFAIMETKTFLVHLITKFEISVVDKTPIPLAFAKNTITLEPEGEIVLGIKAIDNL